MHGLLDPDNLIIIAVMLLVAVALLVIEWGFWGGK